MSTAYSAASVIIPAQGGGGKAGTLYGWRPDVNLLQGIDVVQNTANGSRVNEQGLIEFVPANTPRFDWGEGGSCPSLLVEPQRTNLLLRSEEFDNAAWTKVGVTITPNNAISPNGNLNADTYEVDASNDNISTLVSGLNIGEKYSFSIYLKILSGAVSSFELKGFFGFSGSKRIESEMSSGWKRFDVELTASNTSGQVQVVSNDGATATIAIWGAQLEEGTYASSYIKTEASTATRNADVISKTGIASLIGQSEGTLFAEVDIPVEGNNNRIILQVGDGTGTNQMDIRLSSSKLRVLVNSGNFSQISIGNPTNNFGINKAAITYQSGNLSFFVNGIKVNESLVFTTFSSVISQLNIGDDRTNNPVVSFDGNFKQLAIYKTALTDQEAIALTTL